MRTRPLPLRRFQSIEVTQVKAKTILSVCLGCIALLAFAWLLSQVHQLKVEARELASELERGHQVPLTVGAPVGGVPSVTTVQRVVQLRPQDPIEIADIMRSEEHTSELQSRVDISYAVFCL